MAYKSISYYIKDNHVFMTFYYGPVNLPDRAHLRFIIDVAGERDKVMDPDQRLTGPIHSLNIKFTGDAVSKSRRHRGTGPIV